MIVPIDQDFAGIADSTGAFDSGQLQPTPVGWAQLKVTAQSSGAGKWTIQVGGAPKAFGSGDSVDMAVLVPPSAKVRILVTNLIPNAQVIGKIHGLAGNDIQEIQATISLLPSVFSVVNQPVLGWQVPATFHGNIPIGSTTFLAVNAVTTYELHKLTITGGSPGFDGTFSIFFTRNSDAATLCNLRGLQQELSHDFEGFRLAQGDGVNWFQDSGVAKFADVTFNFRKV